MPYINVTVETFFDKPGIKGALDKKTRKVLSATGAYSRGVMRKSMRRRKKTSEPGGYPSAHAGQLKELIFFGLGADMKSVVIGPTLFKGSGATVSNGMTVPELLNEGGTVTVRKTIDPSRRKRDVVRHGGETFFVDRTTGKVKRKGGRAPKKAMAQHIRSMAASHSKRARTLNVKQVYKPRPFVELTVGPSATKLAEVMEKFELKK